jgi:hypothetical protein
MTERIRQMECVWNVEAATSLASSTRKPMEMSSGMRKAFGLDCKAEPEQTKVIGGKEHQAPIREVNPRPQTEAVERFFSRSRWSSATIRVKSLGEAA